MIDQHAAASQLRANLEKGVIVSAPGAADALTARLVQSSGFEAVYMTGLGATATRLGQPDLGLMTQSEMAEHARSMVRSVDIPVIADADTGYGGPLNIARTVQEYAQAGVAALHLEDQLSPKRCGQLDGVQLLDVDESCLRLTAAVKARGTSGLIIIGRTDALAATGMEEAVKRASRYQDAGVDLVFIDGVKTRAEVESIARQVEGPKVISLVDGTDAATLTRDELQQMGFSIALYAVTALFAAVQASADALNGLKADGVPGRRAAAMSYQEFCNVVDLNSHQQFADKYTR